MPSLLERIVGVPLTLARQREEVESHLRFRDPASLRATLSDVVSHLTQKSGALLAAQAIFLVVDTYGMDHGWPHLAVLISLLTLVAAALLVMGNLHSVYLGAPQQSTIRPSSKWTRSCNSRGWPERGACVSTWRSI